MDLLAYENSPLPVVSVLREKGHDVSWIGTVEPGIDDRVDLRHAHDEERLLITFDKNFGALTFHEDRPGGGQEIQAGPTNRIAPPSTSQFNRDSPASELINC